MADVRTIDLPRRSDAGVASGNGELLFIGTATVLLRAGGFTILTDPNFLHQGQHAPLGYGLRSRRLTQPAMTVDALPPLDFVVLSHHHGDHFDDVAARGLDKAAPIITTPHSARKLERQGFERPVALDTWESVKLARGDEWVRVTATPGKHAPQPLEALLPSVMGSVVEFGRGGDVHQQLYITGDTLMHDALAELPRRYPALDLALVHLGGTRILGVLLTMDADQGVRLLELVRPRHAVPIHFNDYTVFKDDLENFRSAVSRASLATEVHYLTHGETYRF
jgi:L-ascorbate metabolism protein UlaG (beta-lactamase superfamily)